MIISIHSRHEVCSWLLFTFLLSDPFATLDCPSHTLSLRANTTLNRAKQISASNLGRGSHVSDNVFLVSGVSDPAR